MDETGDKAPALEMVCTKLSEQYTRIKKEVDDDDNTGCEHERALFAEDWHPPQFKGKCSGVEDTVTKVDYIQITQRDNTQKETAVGFVLGKDMVV